MGTHAGAAADTNASTLKTSDEVKQFLADGRFGEAWSAISGWLAESPEEAKKQLRAAMKGTIIDLSPALNEVRQTKNGESDFLDQPIFTYPLANESQQNSDDHRILGDVSTAFRPVLQRFPCYEVRFKGWDCLDEELRGYEEPQFESSVGDFEKYRRWSEILMRSYSFRGTVDHETESIAQVTEVLNNVFELFGYHSHTSGGGRNDEDVKVSKCELTENQNWWEPDIGKTVLLYKGEQSRYLDVSVLNKPTCKQSASLCLVGFAIFLASYKIIPAVQAQQQALEEHLKNVLGLRPYKRSGSNNKQSSSFPNEVAPSAYARLLLARKTNDDGGLEKAISDTAKMMDSSIGPKAPVTLWSACMQACHYAFKEKMQYAILCSPRVFWFIKLSVDENQQCCVLISKTFVFGEQGFFRKLISFFQLADKKGKIKDNDQWTKQWQDALGVSVGNNGSKMGNDEAKPVSKKPRKDEGPGPGGASTVSPNRGVVSDSHDHRNRYGVTVPYFYEIGEPEEELGHGRCGVVTRVKWHGEDVALKGYKLQSRQDERYFFDVYEKELQVLLDLKELWGTHIPSLLFHIPFTARPVIGLQLGVPIEEDDMSEWDEKDRESAEQAIQKVCECGWKQRDLRGRNFVRLLGSDGVERIAMIDFEDMVAV